MSDFVPMRPIIYLVDGSPALTGAFVCARNIARALADTAHIVLVIADDAQISLDDSADFAAVHRLPIYHLRRSYGASVRYFPNLILASFGLKQLMRKDGAAFLIVNDFHLMQGAMCRLFGFRGSILTWIRINPKAFGPASGIWLWATNKASDRVIAVSRYIQSIVPEYIATERLYDAIDAGYEIPITDHAPGNRTFIFVGNYIPGKGQDIAIEALSRVTAQFPEATLEFYGGDMGLEKNRAFRCTLEEQARQCGIAPNVLFGEFVSDPRSVMLDKFAALNLSRSESFSMTVLEASACGLAVIATRSGGPEEIIEQGRTGILIGVDNIADCADAMLRLLRDPDSARKMGLAAREKVLQEFSEAAFRQHLVALLRSAGAL